MWWGGLKEFADLKDLQKLIRWHVLTLSSWHVQACHELDVSTCHQGLLSSHMLLNINYASSCSRKNIREIKMHSILNILPTIQKNQYVNMFSRIEFSLWFLVFAARRILLPSPQLWFAPSRFQPCLTNLPTVKRPFHVGWFRSRVSVLNNICYQQGVIWFHVNVL